MSVTLLVDHVTYTSMWRPSYLISGRLAWLAPASESSLKPTLRSNNKRNFKDSPHVKTLDLKVYYPEGEWFQSLESRQRWPWLVVGLNYSIGNGRKREYSMCHCEYSRHDNTNSRQPTLRRACLSLTMRLADRRTSRP